MLDIRRIIMRKPVTVVTNSTQTTFLHVDTSEDVLRKAEKKVDEFYRNHPYALELSR